MSVRAGCGLSTLPDPVRGARAAAETARERLGSRAADLAFVFCSGAHLEDPEGSLAAVHEILAPGALSGCGAAGVVGGRREIEEGTAISVWTANLGEARAESFHAAVEQLEDGLRIDGFPVLEGASALVLLPDPYSFPTEQVLAELPGAGPGVPVLGGLASARGPEGTVLFCDEEVYSSGAVGVRLDGLEVLPCVSQGATPIGPELTVTDGEGNIIHELAGRPALPRLREAVEALDEHETAMLTGGLLLGLVIDAAQTEYIQGDFLVRGLLGADPEKGSIAVGAPVGPGSIVRLHARDAGSASADLRRALELRRTALGDAPPAGVLLFTCNGRGAGMFGTPSHDAAAIAELLADAPTAGFFAGGEIGPVGGQPFLHSFTATAAVFA